MERANIEGTRHVIEFANRSTSGASTTPARSPWPACTRACSRRTCSTRGSACRTPTTARSTSPSGSCARRSEAKTLVYRPGIVVGHSETGEMDKIDGPYYFFKLLQKLRHALPEWAPLAGPQGGETNIVPVDFVAKAMDHIAHLPDADLPGDTFHLVSPEPMRVGDTLNEFARAAHAPQFAMRIDPHMTNAIPKAVRAGLAWRCRRSSGSATRSTTTSASRRRRWRTATSAAPSTRATPSARSAAPASRSRRSRPTPRACGTTGSATSTRTSSATARSPTRSRASGS